MGYDENGRLVENRGVRVELLTPAPPPSTVFSVEGEAIPAEPPETPSPPPAKSEAVQLPVPPARLNIIPHDAWTNPYEGYVVFQVLWAPAGVGESPGPGVVKVRLQLEPGWSLQDYFQKAVELAVQELMDEKSKKSKR